MKLGCKDVGHLPWGAVCVCVFAGGWSSALCLCPGLSILSPLLWAGVVSSGQ